ncbi:MAG: beta-galactosidase [Abditibacteriales bacterium]|nr:beta-galactosidase [Abditibacteriales bacterium]MDW8366621.1 beta-galactosidase [Abditibacteriales bacterium]
MRPSLWQPLWFLLLVSLVLNALPVALAVASPPRLEAVNVAVRHTPLGKRLVYLNDTPTALFWAYELKDGKQLEDYKKAGFNTVYVDVRWVRSQEVPKVIAEARRLAALAEMQGLYVIYGIECVPTITPTAVRVAPDEDAYVRPLREWIAYVVEELSDTPNLIGWGTQHTPSALITHDDVGFQRWLRETYRTTEALNRAWGTKDVQFDTVTMAAAVQWDAQNKPGGLGLATMEVALYRWTTFTRLMQLWANLIRSKDRKRLLVTGRLNDYKSIISVPDNYDVIVPAVYPSDAEPDIQTHNAHAVDMARQANQFIAVPTLMTRGAGQGVLSFASQRALWMREMAMHGAAGIAFQDWNDFGADAHARADIAREIADLTSTPLAEGAVVNGRTLYGFGPGISLDEPNNLFLSYRRGMKFGQVDYLSHEGLLRADLRRYSTILAPLAFHLSPLAQMRLTEFVAGGGVLVADLGAGMIQAGGDLRQLPEPLQGLFGVFGIAGFASASRNLTVEATHPLFPSLRLYATTSGALPNGAAFAPPLGFALRAPDAVNLGYLHRTTSGRALSVTLGVYQVGAGFAIYAPFRLWSHWLPPHRLYEEFHGDLFHRNALCALLDTPLFPLLPEHPNIRTPESSNMIEVGTVIEGAAAFNPLARGQLVRWHTVGVRYLLFSHAATSYTRGNFLTPAPTFRRVGDTALAAMLDVPQPTVALLHDWLPPGALRVYRFLPIQLLPLSRSATGQVVEYSPQKVELNIWTDAADVTTDENNNLTVINPHEAPARLTLMSGLYPIPPHSKHRLTITPLGSKRSERKTITANASGLLIIERKWKAHAITIESERS